MIASDQSTLYLDLYCAPSFTCMVAPMEPFSILSYTRAVNLDPEKCMQDRPKTCLNFLKLCKTKAYNCSLFHTVQPDFIAQTGEHLND